MERSDFQELGFEGFSPISELILSNLAGVPRLPGVYVVLRECSDTPKFLDVGTGGHFKGKNPNVSISELTDNWASDAATIYIGKAGGQKSASNLAKRIGSYLKFGTGQPVGHWGGRLTWQLADALDLVICWKTDEFAERLEAELIDDFYQLYGKLPFANLQKPKAISY